MVSPLERAQFIVEPYDGRSRTVREALQQRTELLLVEYAPLITPFVKRAEFVRMPVACRINSRIRISVAPSPVAPEGSSSSKSDKAGPNSGKALKSLLSNSKQACGVVAR